MNFFWAVLLLRVTVAAAAAAADSPSLIRMNWADELCSSSDDTDCGYYGPDGPWLALAVSIGQGGNETKVAMYPFNSDTHFAIRTGQRADDAISDIQSYDPKQSLSANHTQTYFEDEVADFSYGLSSLMNSSIKGDKYFDLIQVDSSNPYDTPSTFYLNATVVAADSWNITPPKGKSYNLSVGAFGFSPGYIGGGDANPINYTSGLSGNLKKAGVIPSSFVSFHIGSASPKIPGSMLMGGYDKNRAIGEVATSKIDDGGYTSFFLNNVGFGTEEGGSPFADPDGAAHFWTGVGDDSVAKVYTQEFGGADGSVTVFIDLLTPYIYLPKGNCEAAAKFLPVTWQDDIGFYTWNTQDPEYERIIKSPAYMAFSVSDTEAKNITIKVPMQLLNLTLDSPIVDKPTQYFPCLSVPDSDEVSIWPLGRAFLQAAMVAFNYDQKLVHLAQAPGPDVGQRLEKAVEKGDNTLETGPADTFRSSWTSHWEALDDHKKAKGGISKGAIAGIVVGSVVGIGVLAALATFVWRRGRRGSNSGTTIQPDAASSPDELTYHQVQEVQGSDMRHEMMAPGVAHELKGDTNDVRYELDGMQPPPRSNPAA